MSIGVSDSDYVSFYITNSGTCVENAVSALRSAEAAFTLGRDSASAYKCATIINSLSNQARTLHSISNEFENTKETLRYIDQYNSTTFEKQIDTPKNIGFGMALGSLGSVAGHSAASGSLNALRTALYRKGATQLHGFAFEVMFADKLNNGLGHKLFTKAIVDGSNKTGCDVIVKRFGKVVEQYELKATGTKSYAKKAISKANSAYKDSTIVFTDEMAKEVGATPGGYTLPETKGIATAAKTSTKASLALKTIGKSAASAGAVGAVIDGGIEAVTKFSDWKSGKITGKQYFSGIAKEAAIGGAAGAITGAALATAAVLGVTLTGGTALLAGAVIGGIANWGLHRLFGN